MKSKRCFFVGLVSIVLLVSVLSAGIFSAGSHEMDTDEDWDFFSISDERDIPAPPENLEVHHYDFLGEMGDKDFEVWETEMNGDDLFIYYPTEDPEDGYPALALGHGFTHNPDFFVSWGEYYASRGFVIAIPDLGFFYDDGWPDDLLSTLELMKDEDEKEGSPLEGKIAEDRMGLTGFSAGGQAAILAAEQDALEERGLVQAIAPMAPSIYTDGGLLSLNVDIEDLEVPIQLQAGTEDGIVPAEDVEEFYEDLEASDEPSQFYLKDGANHNQYGDDDSFGGIGDGDPKISREEQQRLARKYMISFFNYYLRGEEKYGEYPFGTFINLEVEEGNLVSNEYRNVDYTTSSGIIGFDHNKIVWEPSADDPDNVDHYNLYRSEDQEGPWDEPIEQVVANGSAIYSFVDEEKGDADDIHWWYLVRAVSEEEGEEENNDAVQEPGGESGPIPPADPDPGDGDTGIDLEVELSVLVEHEGDEDMDVSFYDASDESFIETKNEVPSGERASVIWKDLEPDNTYQWYAEADDGEETATSPTWEFTTKEVPDGHELTINIVGEGSTDPEEGAHTYEEGEEVTVEATPAEGWTFVEWTGDETGTETTIDITMDDDKSITAVFQEETIEEYELTIDIQGEGSTEPEEGTHSYEEGEGVTVTATPADGWLFDQWSGDVTGTDSTIHITMDGNRSVTAVFEEEIVEYELSINIEGEGSTDPEEGTYTYQEGEEITVSATPEEGWYFEGWTGDHEDTEEDITITMDNDKEITVLFKELGKAYFEVSIVSPQDGEGFEEGDEIVVEYRVTNTGDAAGEQDIELYVNGVRVETETISLGPDESYQGEFTWYAEEEGEIEFEVRSSDQGETDTVSFAVHTVDDLDDTDDTEDDESFPWWILILLLVLIGVILVVLLLKKRDEEENDDAVPTAITTSETENEEIEGNCESCGSELIYIEEYERWYCNDCEEYH